MNRHETFRPSSSQKQHGGNLPPQRQEPQTSKYDPNPPTEMWRRELKSRNWTAYLDEKKKLSSNRRYRQIDHLEEIVFETLVGEKEAEIFTRAYLLAFEIPFDRNILKSPEIENLQGWCNSIFDIFWPNIKNKKMRFAFIQRFFEQLPTKKEVIDLAKQSILQEKYDVNHLAVQDVQVLTFWMIFELYKLNVQGIYYFLKDAGDLYRNVSRKDPSDWNRQWMGFCERFSLQMKAQGKSREIVDGVEGERRDKGQEKSEKQVSEESNTKGNSCLTEEQPLEISDVAKREESDSLPLLPAPLETQSDALPILSRQGKDNEEYTLEQHQKQKKKQGAFSFGKQEDESKVRDTFAGMLKEALSLQQEEAETKQRLQRLEEEVQQLRKKVEDIAGFHTIQESELSESRRRESQAHEEARFALCEALLTKPQGLSGLMKLLEGEIAKDGKDSDWWDLYETMREGIYGGLKVEHWGEIGEEFEITPEVHVQVVGAGTVKTGQRVRLVGYGWRYRGLDGALKVLRPRQVKPIRNR